MASTQGAIMLQPGPLPLVQDIEQDDTETIARGSSPRWA